MATCSLDPSCTRPDTRGGGCLVHKFEGGRTLRFGGLHTFKTAREGGYTQMGLAKEFRRDAIRKGRSEKVAYVGRERAPTEQFINGRWEQVNARP